MKSVNFTTVLDESDFGGDMGKQIWRGILEDAGLVHCEDCGERRDPPTSIRIRITEVEIDG